MTISSEKELCIGACMVDVLRPNSLLRWLSNVRSKELHHDEKRVVCLIVIAWNDLDCQHIKSLSDRGFGLHSELRIAREMNGKHGEKRCTRTAAHKCINRLKPA